MVSTDRLTALMQGREDATLTPLLILDEELVRATQDRLTAHGLLDPPADGYWGPVSTWALSAFCQAADMEFPDAVTPDLAAALLRQTPVLPLEPSAGFAGAVTRALLRRGDWVCRHPACFTIAYVEGMSVDGQPTPRRPDAFDDVRLLLRCRPGGKVELAGAWQATTAAGWPAV